MRGFLNQWAIGLVGLCSRQNNLHPLYPNKFNNLNPAINFDDDPTKSHADDISPIGFLDQNFKSLKLDPRAKDPYTAETANINPSIPGIHRILESSTFRSRSDGQSRK